MYEHLNLRAWPFQTVPDAEFARVWAGRQQTKQQLDRLVMKMALSPKSGLRLLWANFGMGKTHTLLHLQHLCRQSKGVLVPVYAVMPNRPGGFLDVYRSVVSGLPFDFLGDQLVKVGSGSGGSVALHPMFAKSPGVVNALLAMRSGDLERAVVAQQWLIAQPGLGSADMRRVGVKYRIKTSEDAVNALSALARLASFKPGQSHKLVILLDEYQRIGELKPAVRNEINAGLHALFNANPQGLEYLLSFSFGRQENVAYLLSNELKSRAEPDAVNLDLLTRDEAVEFLLDLLAQFRLKNDGRPAYPFAPDALQTLVGAIADSKTLTPRRVMTYANFVLQESLIGASNGQVGEITSVQMALLLRDPQLGSFDLDEQQ
jgi:hypothetical protein